MDTEEKIIYESIISEYRQALSDAQLGLAMANGQLKVKDTIIAQLTASLTESMPTDTAPKPGPPPAR